MLFTLFLPLSPNTEPGPRLVLSVNVGLLPFPATPPERPGELARRLAWAMREFTVSKIIVLKSSNIFLR